MFVFGNLVLTETKGGGRDEKEAIWSAYNTFGLTSVTNSIPPNKQLTLKV